MKFNCSIILIILTATVAFFWSGMAYAGEKRTEFMVDYRVNITRIDPEYESNAERVREIVDFLRSIEADSTMRIVSVAFCGAASPEGHYAWNRYLAGGRLASLEDVIRDEVEIPDSIISRDDSYIPWEYLREKVAASDLPYKDTVISIIDEEPRLVKYHLPNPLIDHRIVKLKQLDGMKVWHDLFRRFFRKMRNASAVIVTYSDDVKPLLKIDFPPVTNKIDVVEYVPEPMTFPVQKVTKIRKPFYMDLRSNMLYDVALLPNIGVEFWLGKQWSIEADWTYGWLKTDKRHRYWRAYGGTISPRYWFGRAAKEKPLTGQHIGLLAGATTYDFEFGGQGQMGGIPGGSLWNRCMHIVGVEYGYSLPVRRRLNIDFSVAFGYMGGKVEKYIPQDNYYLWQSTVKKHWLGPVKAEISLVWLLGYGNWNEKKGVKL